MSELLVQVPPLTKVMSQLVIGCEHGGLQASELRPATVKVTSHKSRGNMFEGNKTNKTCLIHSIHVLRKLCSGPT